MSDVIYVDCSETLIELKRCTEDASYPHDFVLFGHFTLAMWSAVLLQVVKDSFVSVTDHPGIKRNGTPTLLMDKMHRAIDSDDPEVYITAAYDFIDRKLDRFRMDVCGQIRPHVAKLALWDITMSRGGLIQATYVGDGRLLEPAMLSAGLDFRTLISTLYEVQ